MNDINMIRMMAIRMMAMPLLPAAAVRRRRRRSFLHLPKMHR